MLHLMHDFLSNQNAHQTSFEPPDLYTCIVCVYIDFTAYPQSIFPWNLSF